MKRITKTGTRRIEETAFVFGLSHFLSFVIAFLSVLPPVIFFAWREDFCIATFSLAQAFMPGKTGEDDFVVHALQGGMKSVRSLAR